MSNTEVDLGIALPHIKTSLPGPLSKKILKRRKNSIPDAIKSVYPMVIKRGKGAMIEDMDGNYFMDWVGGVGVLNVGYSQPQIIEAVQNQSESYFHSMMNITTHEGYIELAEKLNAIAPVKGTNCRTMFANSGAEAIENAVKIAKSVTGRSNILVFSGAFHGRTTLTMTMTSKKAYAYGIEPYAGGVVRAEFPYVYRCPVGEKEEEYLPYYIEKLQRVFEESCPAKRIAAIVIEPIQGEGGFVPAPFAWVQAVRKICDEYGILLIADEVQTGFARTGKLFVSNYWQELNCPPDILVMAKSIAGGLPLGAVSASDEIMSKVRKGVIGGTFGGNALACVAAISVLKIIEEQELTKQAIKIGDICYKTFCTWKQRYEVVGDVRGIGSMLGIEFVKDKQTKEPYPMLVEKIVSKACSKGLLIESAGTYGNVIRFLYPLVISKEQIDFGLFVLEKTIEECLLEEKGELK